MAEAVYDTAFFDQQVLGSLSSARTVLPIVWQYFRPRSVVDVGCGRGPWLKAATELGVEDVLGVDGGYVDPSTLLIDPGKFQAADLSDRLTIDRTFDLAISVEVAEHLPMYRSETFVADLAKLSDCVLFSAALPYQGGIKHINEQWLEFWALLFRRHGYVPYDLFRPRIWSNPAVDFWYSQNIVLFSRGEPAGARFPEEARAAGRPLSYPHPLTFLVNVTRYRPLASAALDVEFKDYNKLLETYLSGDTILPLLRILNTSTVSDGLPVPLFPEARTRIVDAAADRTALESEIQRLSAESASRSAEVARLTEEIAEAAARGAASSTELAACRGELERRSLELSLRQAEIKRFGAELTERYNDVKRFERELNERDTNIANLSVKLAESEQRVARLGVQLASREKQTARVSGKLAAASARIQKVSGDLRARERDIRRLTRQIAIEQAGTDRLLQKLNGLEGRDAGRTEELAKRDVEIRRLSDAVAASAAEAGRLRAELTASNERTRGTQAALEQRDGLLRQMRHSILWRLTAPLREAGSFFSPSAFRAKRQRQRILASGLFDADYYLAQNRDVAEAGIDPVTHYMDSGAREGRDPHPLFDTSFYIEQNADIARSGMNPLAHYIAFGAAEGRDPHPLFDTSFYVEQNADVARSGMNPLAHYLAFGMEEGRKPHPQWPVKQQG